MTAPDLSPAFYDAWTAMARRLGVDPIALARSSFAETGMYRRHPRNAAAGVWPFIESTLHRMGWQGSAVDFTAQDPVDQIEPWLERYLRPYAGRLTDDASIYVAMYLPSHLARAAAEGDAHVMATRGDGTNYYEWNTILDRNGDGTITVGDLRRHLDLQVQGSRWDTIEGELRARGASGSPSRPGPLAGVARPTSLLALGLVAAGVAGVWYLYATPDGARVRQNAERRVDRLLSSTASFGALRL